MKTIMIIGAGKSQMPLIEAAKKEGYHTVVCDSNPEAPGVREADTFCKVSTKDRDGLLRTARREKIDGIAANSEYAMCDAAFISSELGLAGNPESAIAVFSSKSKFRELQRSAGLFAPRVWQGIGDEDIPDCPLVVKPDMNSGTRGTTVVRGRDESEKLKAAIEACSRLSRNGKAVVEEYVPISPRHVIEGEIFLHNGEILWDGLFKSIRSEMAAMIPMTYVFPFVEERENVLRDALQKTFSAAGVRHGEYNMEACMVNDEPFVIEINPRQGGNDLPRYVREHCGIDYCKLLVTTSVGDDRYWDSLKGFERQNNRITHHMLYPRKSGRFQGVSIADEIKNSVCRAELDVNVGDEIRKTEDGSSSIGYVDLAFSDSDNQNTVSDRLEDLIRIEVDENRGIDG